MGIKIENKAEFKRQVRGLLGSVVEKPNEDVLSINVNYDFQLNIVTLNYWDLEEDKSILLFDEEVDEKVEDLPQLSKEAQLFVDFMEERGLWDEFEAEYYCADWCIYSMKFHLQIENPRAFINSFGWDISEKGHKFWYNLDVEWNKYLEKAIK